MSVESVAVSGYVAAAVFAVAGVGLAFSGRIRGLLAAVLASALALCSVVALRWVFTGHPPIFGAHENAIASSLALVCVGVLMLRRDSSQTGAKPVGILLGFVVVTLVYGMFSETALYPLTISERSLWVDVHALFAWVAYAELLAAVAVAVAVLLGFAEDRSAADFAQIRRLSIGFATFSAMLGVGAYYSFLLFADWFKWEIVESLAVASWVALGLLIHGRLFWSWRGRRFAWATALLLPLIVLTYWIWSRFPGTYHYFEIPPITAGGM